MCLLRIEFLDLYHKLSGKLAHPTFDSAFSESSHTQNFTLPSQMLIDLGAPELNAMSPARRFLLGAS